MQPVSKMMITVTKPLENAIKQVPDLNTIRSVTSRGSCEISAFMEWNANIDLSQQRIESKIAQIRNNLPPETQITVEKMNPSILPVIGYMLESQEKSPIELKLIANYTIKPFLSQVPGVSEVRIIGGKMKEYRIQLDPHKMSALSVTPELVNTALSQTNFIRSNGYLSDYRFLYLTTTDATFHTIDDLNNIVIRNDGKRVVRIQDIATVDIREAAAYTKTNANGKEGVLIAIIKQPNANLIELSDQMQVKLSELENILPKNVHIEPYYIQADFVKTSIRSVSDSLWIGLALSIVVAMLFLRSLKASITILFTIPITICLTLIILYSVGFTLNIMTLGAIAAAIGLIIDDAIVVVEQIHRTHEEHPEEPTVPLLQKAIRYLLPRHGGFFFDDHCYFPSVCSDDRSSRRLFQNPDKYHDHNTGMFFFCNMDWPACCLLNTFEKISCKKNKSAYSQESEMGFFFYLSSLDQFPFNSWRLYAQYFLFSRD